MAQRLREKPVEVMLKGEILISIMRCCLLYIGLCYKIDSFIFITAQTTFCHCNLHHLLHVAKSRPTNYTHYEKLVIACH